MSRDASNQGSYFIRLAVAVAFHPQRYKQYFILPNFQAKKML